MTPFKQFADSVIGSGLPQQFQRTRLWLTGFFALICALLLLVSALYVYQTTQAALTDFRRQVRRELQRPANPSMDQQLLPPQTDEGPNAREKAVQREIFERVMLVVLVNNLVLLAILTFAVWVALYFLLRPLAQSVEEKSRFLSQASHELRTPLAILHSELSLSSEEDNIQELKRVHAEALVEIRRLHQLSERLLGRIGGDQSSVDKQEIELRELVERAWENLKQFRKSHHIKIDFTSVKVTSDPVLLYQLAFNLLQNFLKHSPGQSLLLVSFDVKRNILKLANPVNGDQFEEGTGLRACRDMAAELDLELTVNSAEGRFLAAIKFPRHD